MQIDIGNKCAHCSTWFHSWAEYDGHVRNEHDAIERGEPFAKAYRGGLVICRPGGWRPIVASHKAKIVDAGELRLGRHNFFGHQNKEVVNQ